ncbi:unnamed protein product [Paramecium octaurelia]|uniref:Uncharacterized protein n=1 Tax=Paramecium octaurelia TaxID=43137 RepID=A0A8S1SDD2_PAROT|nr:unnamed protein product [Paramecium octaurelia]
MQPQIWMLKNSKHQFNNFKISQKNNNNSQLIIFIKLNNTNNKINANNQMILYLKKEKIKINNLFSIQSQQRENSLLISVDLEMRVLILRLNLAFIQKQFNINIDYFYFLINEIKIQFKLMKILSLKAYNKCSIKPNTGKRNSQQTQWN